MWVLYILFTLLCCLVTYKIACHQFMKLDKINSRGIDAHQEYICKALEEIANIKNDVNQIKKDIYQ